MDIIFDRISNFCLIYELPDCIEHNLKVIIDELVSNIINYSTILNDTKTTYGKWTPHNSYGGFAGNITAKLAVERSTNTIPVALVNEMGVGTSFNFLTQKLNIKNLILYHTEESHKDERQELYTKEAKKYFNGNVIVPNDLEIIDIC